MPGPPPIAPPITPPPGPIGADDVPELEASRPEAPRLDIPELEVPGAEDEATRAIPGLTPPPPGAPGPPTRPVPVIRPHVFYFDDLSARAGSKRPHEAPPPGSPGPDPLAGAQHAAAGVLTEASTPGEPGTEGRATSRQRRLATQAMVAAAVALLVAGGAVYVALEGNNHPGHQTAGYRGSGSVSTAHTVQPTATTAPSASTVPTTTPASTSSSSSSSTTSTPSKPVLLLSATAGTDTYQLTSKTASIVVTAKGPCWVEVRAGSPQGQVVTEQTLETDNQVKVTGPAWIRLGDPPYAKVSVDGSPTTVPGSQYGVPLNLDFTVS